MKLLTILFCILSSVTIYRQVYAISATTSAKVNASASAVLSATTSAKTTPPSPVPSDKAKDILNRISDKATQLGQTFKKVYLGKIKSLKNNMMVITTDSGDISVDTTEATNFYRVRSGQKTTIEFKSLKTDMDILVSGTLDETTNTISARTVIDKLRRFQVFGRVEEINLKKGRVIIKTAEDLTKEVNIADTVSQKKLKDKDLVTYRDSEIAVGDYLSALGIYEDSNTYLTALRTILIPQASASANIKP